MNELFEQITDWLKEMLVSAIMNNLSGLFDTVNEQVGSIATEVGLDPGEFFAGGFYDDPEHLRDSDPAHCWHLSDLYRLL